MLTDSNVQISACFAIIGSIAATTNELVDITLFSLIPTKKHIYTEHIFISIY